MTIPESHAEHSNPGNKTEHPEGWYDYAGGKRFWDGEAWTDHYAYVQPPSQSLGFWEIAGAVALGVILGFAALWLGAQMAPDDIYLPVKFVVDSDRLDLDF